MSCAKLPMIVAAAALVTPVTSWAQDATRYEVVINHEEQYAIWVAGEEAPPGWELTGRTGSLGQAMDYIEEVWTDMRPLSVRRQMSERRMDRDETMYVVLRREEGRERGIARGYYGYMLWPAGAPYPEELTPTGRRGTFREASDYIEEVWTDMRPLSIRNRFKRPSGSGS